MIPILSSVFETVSNVVSGTVGKFIEDKDKAKELETALTAQLTTSVVELMGRELDAQKSVIVAEAQGESWLQRNWRPIIMIALSTMVCIYWMGWTHQELDQPVILKILDIVQIGLGGYIGGRTAEKLADRGVEIFRTRAVAISAGEGLKR
ncbi:3TM-type holin [Aeromonas salmonicida]|uniref:3TM-type holin n=1 Tax=Aeromonas salmonicida TaxID=645 RepID=UPI001F3920F9|nr:3TM-type holin [Aeromonas salmonicida]MCE9932763.1 holin family protein [Aeromonas salmonicida]